MARDPVYNIKPWYACIRWNS